MMKRKQKATSSLHGSGSKRSCFYDHFRHIFHPNLKEDVSNLILQGETRGSCSPKAQPREGRRLGTGS